MGDGVICEVCEDCPDLVPYGWCEACKNAAGQMVPRRDRIYVVGKHGQPSRFEYVGRDPHSTPDSEPTPPHGRQPARGMSEPSMVERLARKVSDPEWGKDEVNDEYARRQARWWLRAIAEELDGERDRRVAAYGEPVSDAAAAYHGWRKAEAWLRTEADR